MYQGPLDAQRPVQTLPATRPAERPLPETGFAENFQATRREMEIAGNIDAGRTRLSEQYQPIIDELERVGARFGQGQHFLNPASLTSEASSAYGIGVPGQAEMRRMIHAEIARRRQSDPTFLTDVPDTPDAFDRVIAERYTGQLRDIRRTQGGATTWGSVGGFVGGVAGSFEDPVNLATMPIGGSSATVAGSIARAAIENAIVEALSQPAVRQNYAELGERQTVMDSVRSILFAGAAGGTFRGVIEGARAAGPAYDRLVEGVFNALPEPVQQRWANAATLDDRLLVDVLRGAVPEDNWTPELRASVDALDRQADISESTPFDRNPVSDDIHANSLSRAMRSILEGVPPLRVEEAVVPQVRAAPVTGRTGPSAVGAQLRGAGLPDPVVAGFLGNFDVEGGYGGAVGDGGSAFGIAQWRHDRVANFERVIGIHPRNATHDQQAQFVLWEMRNPQSAGMTVAQRDAILAARTPEEAARLIDRYYERSNGQHRERRAEAARRHAGGTEVAEAPPLRMDDEGGELAELPTVLRSEMFEAPEDRVAAQRQFDATVDPSALEFEPARYVEPARTVLAQEPDMPTPLLAQALNVTIDEARQVRALAGGDGGEPVRFSMPEKLPLAANRPFREWMEETVGTRNWVVAPRLGARMAERYDLAIPPKRFRYLEGYWRELNDPAFLPPAPPRSNEFYGDRQASLERIIRRADEGGYGARSGEVADRARAEVAEIAQIRATLADIDVQPSAVALKSFDEPAGEGARMQAESLEHDLRAWAMSFPPENTRGRGVFYHGARGEVPELSEGYYNPANIYGGFDTFYTTDAVDIATGYGRKNAGAQVYRVTERDPVNFYDMEARVSPEEIGRLFGVKEDDFGLVPMAIDEATGADGKVNLREAMDEIRDASAGEGVSRDEVQEIFSSAIYNLKDQGFGGMRHIGGLKTGRQPHEVKIYFDAPSQLDLSNMSPPRNYNRVERQPQPEAEPEVTELLTPANDTNDPLADLRAALTADPALSARKFVTEELGEASLDEILEDLDSNRAFAAAMRACL